MFVSRNDSNEIWKLGSLYWTSSINTENEDFFSHLISFHTSHGTLKTLPPEDREVSSHKLIRSSKEVHRRDSYAFVNLVGQLLYDSKNPPKLSDMILASENSIQSFSYTIKSFVDNLNSLPFDERKTMEELLNNKLFVNCVFVQIRQFFNNFNTFSEFEKGKFFETFIEQLQMLPDPCLVVNVFMMIVSSRVIMSNDFIYNDVMPYFLIPLKEESGQSMVDDTESQQETDDVHFIKTYSLTDGRKIALSPLINTSIYREKIIDQIANLYCVHDYKIRMLLLLYLPHYGSLISKHRLRKIILPQILLGIKDSSNELVSLTFRALAVLIDLFGVVNVLGGSNRTRYFINGVSRHSRLSSQTTNTESNLDERDLSNVSIKSNASSSSFNYKMSSHLISERSSPDGDEIGRTSQLCQSESNEQLKQDNSFMKNLNWKENDEDWPEWEENDNAQLTGVPVTELFVDKSANHKNHSFKNENSNHLNGKPPKKSHRKNIQTFDIKEIDFKDFEDKDEIDNLFLDLAPVLNFTKPSTDQLAFLKQSTHLNSDSSKHEDTNVATPPPPMNMHLFEPKHDENDVDSSAWNDGFEWNDVNSIDGDNNETIDTN